MTETIERLKSTVNDLSPGRKEIEVELHADEVAHEFEHVLEHFAERARLKGFRPGKAPKDMVKKIYAREIRQTLIDELVPKVLEEVLADRHIHPAVSPSVEDLSFEEGQPLRFKAVVEVWPEFVLPAYRKIRATRKEASVPDADIDIMIEDLRRKSAEYIPVEDRGVIAGDYVVFELQSRDHKTKRMRPVEKAVLLAGRTGNDPAVDAAVIGMKPAETKQLRHIVPADSPHRTQAGKDVESTLKILSIKAEKLPALDDDFAKSLGQYDGLPDLREKIRAELLRSREAQARRETSEDILRQLVEGATIDLPPAVIEEEAAGVLKKSLEQIRPEGVTPALIEELRPRAREQAASNLKRHLLLKRIAEEEKIEIGEEEIDQEIRDLAKANSVPAARLLDSFNAEGRREGLRTTLVLRKTVDFLVTRAIMD
jgi:trigger factor